MKINKKATYVASALTFAVCTAGIIGGVGSAHAGTSRTNRHQQQESHYEAHISKAISDGKLTLPTGVTKDALISEHKSLASELTSARKDERKTIRKKVRDEARAWAQQHGIAVKWLLGARHIQ